MKNERKVNLKKAKKIQYPYDYLKIVSHRNHMIEMEARKNPFYVSLEKYIECDNYKYHDVERPVLETYCKFDALILMHPWYDQTASMFANESMRHSTTMYFFESYFANKPVSSFQVPDIGWKCEFTPLP